MDPYPEPLVTTIKERCRACYTCVRECPAKAIRIIDKQADVIPERCIGCGNCVRVCSQKAKQVASDLEYVYTLLKAGPRVAAIIAPSFPAEFVDVDTTTFVGMVRAAGFDLVMEVGFGADLVATKYRHLLEQHPERRFIATSCPAVVAYVERYHPGLVGDLAPIVSPMIATARVVRKMYGDKMPIVFIGPCLAKKGEAASDAVVGEVNAVMTFTELRRLFELMATRAEKVTPTNFDPPFAAHGGLFPISRGMLQAANIDEDLATGEVMAADGRTHFVDAIREFESGDLEVQLLECLCCSGCIMGPGFTQQTPLFRRRAQVSRYVRESLAGLDRGKWKRDLAKFLRCNLERTYHANDQRVAPPSEEDIQRVFRRMGKLKPEDELNCGACGYETCRDHAIAICKGLAESEMCLPYVIEELEKTCGELKLSNEQLASVQEALRHSERLASMGQLAAGIAHEVNNPLGTVLMLAHTLLEEVQSSGALHEELGLIASEADRCRKIVSGLLQFARKNRVDAQRTNIAGLARQALRTLAAPANVAVVLREPRSGADRRSGSRPGYAGADELGTQRGRRDA